MPKPPPSSRELLSPPGPAEIGAGAPNPEKCQAGRKSHGLDLPLCFVKPTPRCRFGLPFAGAYFCRHPEVERIIARTRAQK